MKNKQLFLALLLGATMPAMYGMEDLKARIPNVVQTDLKPFQSMVTDIANGDTEALSRTVRNIRADDIIRDIKQLLTQLKNNLPELLSRVPDQFKNEINKIFGENTNLKEEIDRRLKTIQDQLETIKKQYVDGAGHLKMAAIKEIESASKDPRVQQVAQNFKKDIDKLYKDINEKINYLADAAALIQSGQEITLDNVLPLAGTFGIIRRIIGLGDKLSSLALEIDSTLPIQELQMQARSISDRLQAIAQNIIK